jgi:hypothetical protein
VAAQRGPLSLAQAKALGEKLMASLVGGRITGSSLDSGRAMAKECLHKAGLTPEAPESQPTEFLPESQIDEVLCVIPPDENGSESRPTASETNGRTDEELRGRGLHSYRFQLNLSSSVHRVTHVNS